MQIPILSGVFTDTAPDFRQSYPVNMVPVALKNGISNGYLRPGDGIVQFASGPGVDRGGVEYDGICYRVMGTKLITVSSNGTITILGDVGGPTTQLVTFTYSFDLLAIASGGRLYYWNPATQVLAQVTDPDLGTVLDVVWVDGYFMTTDGEFLVVTELTNPFDVNPLKYGSSEIDPDPIVALIKLRNEIYAINANTIEVFDNIGGSFFPFNRVDGAQVQKGAVGTHACCEFMQRIAFVGGGRNEAPSVYLAANASTEKIATREIDQILEGYSEAVLSQILLESRVEKDHTFLYIHLPDRTLVFDGMTSAALQQPVWFILTSTTVGFAQYRARNFVYCYDKWIVGDPQAANLGFVSDQISSHWGQIVRWEFGTVIVYNESNGAVFHQMELVSLTGSVALGQNPTISTAYSTNGQAYSQDRFIKVGTTGTQAKRLVWFQQGFMRNWRVQRFRGTSDAHISVARLEVQLEAMAA
jgi:hypothetical protein